MEFNYVGKRKDNVALSDSAWRANRLCHFQTPSYPYPHSHQSKSPLLHALTMQPAVHGLFTETMRQCDNALSFGLCQLHPRQLYSVILFCCPAGR